MEHSIWNTIPDEWRAASGQDVEEVLHHDVQVPMFVAPGGSNTKSDLNEASSRRNHTDDPMLASFLLSLIAAGLAGLGWYILFTLVPFRVDFAAVFVGLFIGLAMTMRVHHPGSFRLCASFVITIATLIVVQYFFERHAHIAARRSIGLDASHTPLLYLSGKDAYTAVLESIRSDPTKMLFWALACFAAIKPSLTRHHR